MIVIGTFLRGPNWNFFGPYEKWDLANAYLASRGSQDAAILAHGQDRGGVSSPKIAEGRPAGYAPFATDADGRTAMP